MKLARRLISHLPRGQGMAGRFVARRGHDDIYDMIGPLEGLRMRLDTSEQFQSLMYCGAYQPDLLIQLQRLIQPGDVVLTAGAHVGYMMLAMANMGAKVVGFECDPNLVKLCQENLDLNDLDTTLIPVGLGITDSVLDLNVSQVPGQSSFALPHHSDYKALVRVRRGDHVLKEIGIDRLDGLLIDVEGWECHLLNGLSETLTNHLPRWAIIECMDWALEHAGSSVDELKSMLHQFGWRFTVVGTDLICVREAA